MSINAPLDVDPAEALAACAARGDLAARWYLRARARGETVSEEHARRVAELEAADGTREQGFTDLEPR